MKVAGLIFSDMRSAGLSELTAVRTAAAIPFGARYRLVDFSLSALVAAGISDIGVWTRSEYRSLIAHVGNGKDFDLARRNGGIRILPPFLNGVRGRETRKNRVEALFDALDFIEHTDAETWVLCDTDTVFNPDIGALLAVHEKKEADLTMLTVSLPVGKSTPAVPIADASGRLLSIGRYAGEGDVCTVCGEIYAVRRTYLCRAVREAFERGEQDFYRGVIGRNLQKDRVFVSHHNGFSARIDSLEAYFAASMALLSFDVRADLFAHKDRPILTKICNYPPTRYLKTARAEDVLCGDGSVIAGSVEHSIIFRNVEIGRASVVRNSILMSGTVVEEGAVLDGVIADKNVTVRAGRTLTGRADLPLFLAKGSTI